jgi:hypothetical protein
MGESMRLKFLLVVVIVISLSPTCIAQGSGSVTPTRDPKLPVLRGSTPIKIIGTVVAHDQDGGIWLGAIDVDEYLDFLIIRVDRVLKGRVRGNYVRADFLGGGDNRLPRLLFEGKPWKLKLEPVAVKHYRTCDWTIPPSPPPNSLEMAFGPHLVGVGGAGSFPDPNALYCYVMVGTNLEQIDASKP